MQAKAYNDYISGNKKGFSPRPGGSFHEAGRAFDLDLSAIEIPLSELWRIAARVGLYPIIKEPNPNLSEAWHFECRGSHQLVYNYYSRRDSIINFSPYMAATASAIVSVGVLVDAFKDCQAEAAIQSCLIRLGMDIENIDGVLGGKTHDALKELGIHFDRSRKIDLLTEIQDLVTLKFPRESNVP